MGIKLLNCFYDDEKGQSVVLVAAAMVVLLAIAACTIDVGYLFFQKRSLQNVADAAALAGARELIDGNDAKGKAEEYVLANDLDSDEIEDIDFDDRYVTVKLKDNHNLFFASVLGFSNANIAARAKAAVGPIRGMSGLRPVGLNETMWNEAKQNPDKAWLAYFSSQGPGTWGYVFFTSDDKEWKDATIENEMEHGSLHEIFIGQDIYVNQGNVPGAREPVQDLIDNEIVVYVPIVKDWDGDPGGGQGFSVEVIGFAAVQFTFQDKQGSNYILKGKFIETVGAGDIDPDAADDFGLKGIALVE
jgi:hypothetical protein